MASREPRRSRPYRALGEQIKVARKGRKLSQEELAPLAGVSQGYISHIELGMSRPEPPVLRDLARVLGLDYEHLAPLVGYAPPLPREAIIEVPADHIEQRRRLASLPADLLGSVAQFVDSVEQFVARTHLKPPPQEPAGPEANSADDHVTAEDHSNGDAIQP